MHFDISPVENSGIDFLNAKKLASYFNGVYKIDLDGESDKLRLLKNSSIFTELDEKMVATVGGHLVFSDKAEKFLPHAVIVCAVINGTDITDEVIKKKKSTEAFLNR